MVKRVVMGVICVLLAVLVLCALVPKKKPMKADSMYYAKSAVVSTIDEVRGYVGFTDLRGDEWYWYCDTHTAPWSLDDEVLLVMNSNGSQYAYDDVIVSITTEGIDTHTVA